MWWNGAANVCMNLFVDVDQTRWHLDAMWDWKAQPHGLAWTMIWILWFDQQHRFGSACWCWFTFRNLKTVLIEVRLPLSKQYMNNKKSLRWSWDLVDAEDGGTLSDLAKNHNLHWFKRTWVECIEQLCCRWVDGDLRCCFLMHKLSKLLHVGFTQFILQNLHPALIH